MNNSSQGYCSVSFMQAQPFSEFLPRTTYGISMTNNKIAAIRIQDSFNSLLQKNEAQRIRLENSEKAVIEENMVLKGSPAFPALEIKGSRNIVIQKNIIEGHNGSAIVISASDNLKISEVSVLGNHVQKNNGFGILTENIAYIASCKGNLIKENKQGDYGVGPLFGGQTSTTLKQKCENK